MRSLISLALVLQAAAACGSTSEAAPTSLSTPEPQATAAPEPDNQQVCVQMFTKNRECTDHYIPALVDARAKYDQPPGIAAKVKADRDAIIAQAKTEWAEDSKDEAIAQTCERLVASMTDAQRSDVDQARSCLSNTDCAAYTTCVMPLFEKRFQR
ncbi:MAG: hypothetical protein AB7O24_19210 [Kofleriaceae bacterium]